MRVDVLFSSVFLTILQIFSLEATLISDQGWINVGAYDPKAVKIEHIIDPTR